MKPYIHDCGTQGRIVDLAVDSSVVIHQGLRIGRAENHDLVTGIHVGHQLPQLHLPRYGGYIAQSTGDGIFALFGAPVA
jgi:hypothetical protein